MSRRDQIEAKLRETFEDRRLSRGERHALKAVLSEMTLDARDQSLIRHDAFQIAREALHGPTGQEVLDWLEDVVSVMVAAERGEKTSAEACFSPGENCRRRITNLLNDLRAEAQICVFTITDNAITEAILAAQRRGARVRIITDDEKTFDRGSDIQRLARAGIAVQCDDSRFHMHHKFAVFDCHTLLTGSYNWTLSAAEHNQENIVVSNDPRLVRSFTDEFEQLWTRFGG